MSQWLKLLRIVRKTEKLKNLVSPYIDGWDPHLMNNSCGTML